MRTEVWQWLAEEPRQAAALGASALALILSLCDVRIGWLDPAWLAVLLCGVPILREGAEGLFTRFDIRADVLVSLALVASVIIGEIFAAGEVAFIMQLGALLEERTVARARAGIERLVHLTPRTARRLAEGGTESVIPAEAVRAGDTLRVLPGETIPVDGVILDGQTAIDQSVMTGESLPVDKGPGDEVSSGTVNQFGAFDMRAVKVGEDSALQRMIRLVQSADAGKARIVRLADRWATWIVLTALLAAAGTWIISGEVLRAVTILVVFCPCALVLATPTAIMAAIGNATRHGVLVKEGDALERLARVRTVAFDKTGTLTFGTPGVARVYSALPDLAPQELLRLTSAAEERSEHPLGKAIVRHFRTTGEKAAQAEDFRMLPGRGVSVRSDGRQVLAGNAALLAENGITLPPELEEEAQAARQQGQSLVYVALDGKAAGLVALADQLRPTAAQTLAGLKRCGVETVLLTGDSDAAAQSVARQLPLSGVRAHCLPKDKLNWIRQQEAQGRPVCMIGDGINDAPALKTALVGVAMGGAGSDIAVDAADMALVQDDIRELPHIFSLARRMMRTITCNLGFSLLLNFAAIFLAMGGLLSPVSGALVHNAGSVLVIVNSALLLHWQARDRA